jgi:transcriptional/translational regulatory protein YebC/TACO1
MAARKARSRGSEEGPGHWQAGEGNLVAAKMGGADPASNARLFAAVEKARRASVSRDVIERAIKKGRRASAAKRW